MSHAFRRAARRFLHRLCFALAMVAGAPLAVAQSGDAMAGKTVFFRVVIGADGRLVSGLPRDPALGDAYLRAALALAKDMRFQPAQSDGIAVASETTLSMVTVFDRQADGSYKLLLKGSRLLTEPVKMPSPVFPRVSMTNVATAALVLAVVVKPDGTVDPAQIRVVQSAFANADDATRAKLVKSASDAAARWQFLPNLVGGKPVASLTAVPMRFCSRQGCDDPPAPIASEEVMAMPRSMTPGQVLPVLPHSGAMATSTAAAMRASFRIGIDAHGTVTSAVPTGKPAPAAAVQVAREALQAVRFFPAQVAGRAVSSEMTVAVPVREDGDKRLQAQVERLAYEYQLASELQPWLPPEMSGNGIDARIRYRIVTNASGRADMKLSKVEKIELSPVAPSLNRRIEDSVREAMKELRIEPVFVDGKPLPISFVRGFYVCSGSHRECAFDSLDDATRDAMRAPPGLPDGVVLAKLVP